MPEDMAIIDGDIDPGPTGDWETVSGDEYIMHIIGLNVLDVTDPFRGEGITKSTVVEMRGDIIEVLRLMDEAAPPFDVAVTDVDGDTETVTFRVQTYAYDFEVST